MKRLNLWRWPILTKVLLISIGAVTGSAQTQVVVTDCQPRVVRVGEDNTVRLSGKSFDGAVKVWTSFPASVSVLEQQGELLVCRISLSADAPIGVGALVVSSSSGISGPLWVLVDHVPAVFESNDNHQIANGQTVALPVVIQGKVDGEAADYFAFDLQAGQAISLDVFASRIGSACDPVIRILSADGKQVAFVDDVPEWSAESRLRFVAPETGRYVVELRDNSYRSAEPYLLRVGDFPLVTTTYPLAIPRAATMPLFFLTSDGTRLGPRALAAPRTGRIWATSIQLAESGPVGIAQTILSSGPEYIETEPDLDPQAPMTISVPSAVNGVLDRPDDQDSYRFAARQGDRWYFASTTRRLGSPAYVHWRIQDSQGKVVAEAPVTDQEDPELSWQAPQDGAYQLTIEELTRHSGPTFVYRVQIEQRPFVVALKPVKETRWFWNVPERDGVIALDLSCGRFGYDGPIRIDWEEATDGEWFDAVIPAKANERRVYWRPAGQAGDLLARRLNAFGGESENAFRTVVDTARLIRLQNSAMVAPPMAMEGMILVAIGPPTEPILAWKSEPPTVELQPGAKKELVVEFERKKADYKEAPNFVLGKLSDGLAVTGKVDQDKLVLTIEALFQIAQGTHAMRIGLIANYQGRMQVLPLDLAVSVKSGMEP